MGLCLLFEEVKVFEKLRLAFLMGDPIGLERIRIRLRDRASNMNYKEPWTEDLQEAYDLSTKMRFAFYNYGKVKVAEAHVRHPRYDCTTLEEVACMVTVDTFDSSTTGIGVLDDLSDS